MFGLPATTGGMAEPMYGFPERTWLLHGPARAGYLRIGSTVTVDGYSLKGIGDKILSAHRLIPFDGRRNNEADKSALRIAVKTARKDTT